MPPSFIPVICFDESQVDDLQVKDACKQAFIDVQEAHITDSRMQLTNKLFTRIDGLLKAEDWLIASDLVRMWMLTILQKGCYNDVDRMKTAVLTPQIFTYATGLLLFDSNDST